ncbi:MAG TPA: hypothetical protein VMP68_16285 [Candidatus Eisenbacteria bacterium]|nr:hypothetical protein [Candidatus Eisenbacteria bacterium]
MSRLKTVSKLFLAVAVIATVMPIEAQQQARSARTRFDVVIPFDFIVGNHKMPAGSYRFESVLNSEDTMDILVVRGNESYLYQAVTAALVPAPALLESRLTFKRYGASSFLSGVWIRGKRNSLQLYQSVLEKETAQAQLAAEEVKLTLPEEVAVAAVRKSR